MTIQDAIIAAEERARDFHAEEIQALREQEPARAKRCRHSAATLEEFARFLIERALSDPGVRA